MRDVCNYEITSNDFRGFAGFLLKFVRAEDLENKTILDIGCGFGWFEHFCLQRKSKKIFAIEPTSQGLEVAKRTVKSDLVQFRVVVNHNYDQLDAHFDSVFCWEVLEHIPKGTESLMFNKVYQTMKPGGTFYLSTPHHSFFSNITDPAWWLTGHRHYSIDQIRKFAQEAQFEVEEMRVTGGWIQVLYTLNFYVAKWIFRRKPFAQDYLLSKLEDNYSQPQDGFCNIVVRMRR